MQIQRQQMEKIWIHKVIPINKSKYKVVCENSSPFVLYKGELLKYGIKAEMELDQEVYEEIRNKILAKRAKKRAMHLLEKMDRTEGQIVQKLKEGLYPEDIIEETIAFLYSYHYLDDQRYTENYVRYYGTSLSKRVMKQKLVQKGVSKELVEEQLENFASEDEEEKITKILKKRHFSYAEVDEKVRQKTYRYLLGKGFPYEEILRAMKKCE